MMSLALHDQNLLDEKNGYIVYIDMLNLFKSRILQSFLNFLIGAVVTLATLG